MRLDTILCDGIQWVDCLILLLFRWIFLSSSVAGMTDDIHYPTPYRPVHLFAPAVGPILFSVWLPNDNTKTIDSLIFVYSCQDCIHSTLINAENNTYR